MYYSNIQRHVAHVISPTVKNIIVVVRASDAGTNTRRIEDLAVSISPPKMQCNTKIVHADREESMY